MVINKGVKITQQELSKLLKLPDVTFDLPLNEQSKIIFNKLIRQQSKRGFAGVYFWRHTYSQQISGANYQFIL